MNIPDSFSTFWTTVKRKSTHPCTVCRACVPSAIWQSAWLGIYYTYLKKQGGYRLGELQIALFKNTDPVEAVIPSDKKAVPVVLAANDYYAPILCTCLESIRGAYQ